MKIFLAPFGLVYSFFVSIRNSFYARGIFKTKKLSKPVISVGNLTVGGTGKTPFVDILLTELESKNLKACVLTRGYGRKSSNAVLITENTKIKDGGDEPVWLFQNHPSTKIVVDSDRVAGSKMAGDVDVFILDDGMQHLEVHRDFEVTLIDVTRPLEDYHPLPWGLARENWSALRRSDIVILTRVNLATDEQVDSVVDQVLKQGVMDVIESSIHIEDCLSLETGEPIETTHKKVALVSAIGNPDSFEALVKTLDVQIVDHEKQVDHAAFINKKIQSLVARAKVRGADLILITEKDAVKWKEAGTTAYEIPVAYVVTKLSFNPELPSIYDLATHSLS